MDPFDLIGQRLENFSSIYDDDGPSATVQGSRPMFNDGGMLVQPSDDGSRPGYAKPIDNPLTKNQKQKVINAFPDIKFDFDTYPKYGVKKYLTGDDRKTNKDYTKVDRFTKKGFTLEQGKGLSTRGKVYQDRGKRLSVKDQEKIKSLFELPPGEEWDFKTHKYGIKQAGRENLLVRMARVVKEKKPWTIAADVGSPKGWMLLQMNRVYKNELKDKVKNPTYKPVYEKINGVNKIIGFKDNTTAGQGKTYYGLDKYSKKNAADWTKHGDYKQNVKLFDIAKRSNNAPNEVITGLLNDKGFKGKVTLNNLVNFLSGIEETSPAAIKNAIVRHHNSGVAFGSATNDLSLTTQIINKKIVEAEQRIRSGNILPEDIQLLKNNNIFVRGSDGKLYGAGKKSAIGQFKQIESDVAGALESGVDFKGNKFNNKQLKKYLNPQLEKDLLKLAGTKNKKCKNLLAYGGRAGLAEGLSPEFCINEGKKVARDLVAKNIKGSPAQNSIMKRVTSGVTNFVKSALDPKELFDIKKQLFSKGAVASLPIFDAGIAAYEAAAMGKPIKEAISNTLTFGSIPRAMGAGLDTPDVLNAKQLLKDPNLSPAGKEYAQLIIDSGDYEKMQSDTTGGMTKKFTEFKEMQDKIKNASTAGRFDYESRLNEVEGAEMAKDDYSPIFGSLGDSLKNKAINKRPNIRIVGPMTSKKDFKVDLTPTTYENFKPDYGFTKEQFEDAMRKEGALADDQIYEDNFYKQEVEKPIEFEQLMKLPSFRGASEKFAGGGIAGLSGGDPKGAMLTSMNPDSQGLSGILKRVKKI